MFYLATFVLGWLAGMLAAMLRSWWANREDWRESQWGPAKSTWTDSRQVGFCYYSGGWFHAKMNRGEWRRLKRIFGYSNAQAIGGKP